MIDRCDAYEADVDKGVVITISWFLDYVFRVVVRMGKVQF